MNLKQYSPIFEEKCHYFALINKIKHGAQNLKRAWHEKDVKIIRNSNWQPSTCFVEINVDAVIHHSF